MFGLDFTTLSHENEDAFPEVVPGRVLQLDGDFVCYQCACHAAQSFSEMARIAELQIRKLQKLAGAEHLMLHLTSSASTKGGRYAAAIQQPYQKNREGKNKPEHLERLRMYLMNRVPATLWVDREADDGMAKGNATAAAMGTPERSIICSKDKDLRMVPGYHLDWDTHGIFIVSGFGDLVLDATGATTKCRGTGPKFFWAQMLMGDVADSVKGLPKITPSMCLKYLDTITNKPKSCGPVATYRLLKDIKTDVDAFNLVLELYREYSEHTGFLDFTTGKRASAEDVFISEARMLWMQETDNPDDVLDYFNCIKGARNELQLHPRLCEA